MVEVQDHTLGRPVHNFVRRGRKVLVPRGDQPRTEARNFAAATDAAGLVDEIGRLAERAVGVHWYESIGNDADLTALALCRYRRARAGIDGGILQGDAAVREILETLSPRELVWITSRAISYMDENGFPDAIEPFVAESA
jgi:hypothetical protein